MLLLPSLDRHQLVRHINHKGLGQASWLYNHYVASLGASALLLVAHVQS